MSIRIGETIISGGDTKFIAGRNIGDIFYTSRADNTLNGAVECNGATYNTADYIGSGNIGQLLADGKIPYVSLADYATAISTKGWCDKVGWNGAGNTDFRVPTLTAHIVQKNNIPVVGNNQRMHVINVGTSGTWEDKALNIAGSDTGVNKHLYQTSTNIKVGLATDASKSGIIADLSDVATTERVMIQLSNGATDEAVATCTGVLSDVANLKDLSNLTSAGKEVIAHNSMPSSRHISLTTGASGTTYTAPADGYFAASFTLSSAAGYGLLRANEISAIATRGNASATYCYLPISKGTVCTLSYNNSTAGTVLFIYAEGSKSN